MKTVEAALAAVLGLCAVSGTAAQARSSEFSQTYGYVYGEFSHLRPNFTGFDGGGIGAGWHFSRYLGIQAGGEYFHKSPVELTGANAELMLTYPATDRFSLYGAVGGSYLHGTAYAGPQALTGNSTGYRIGIGMEYWFLPHLGLRAGYHRQNAGWVADEMSVGLGYRF